jgi:hypothetical protein
MGLSMILFDKIPHETETKSGTVKFSHLAGTHDDQLWSLALAVYASQQQTRPNFKSITRSF